MPKAATADRRDLRDLRDSRFPQGGDAVPKAAIADRCGGRRRDLRREARHVPAKPIRRSSPGAPIST